MGTSGQQSEATTGPLQTSTFLEALSCWSTPGSVLHPVSRLPLLAESNLEAERLFLPRSLHLLLPRSLHFGPLWEWPFTVCLSTAMSLNHSSKPDAE